MAKMSLDDLRKLRDEKKNDINRREVEGKEIQVIIGMGTCGIAAGAKSIVDTFLKLINDNKLVDTVIIRQTGCMGLCHVEPTVEVVAPGMPPVIYGPVDVKASEEIVKKHIIGKELLGELIRDRPAADILV